MTTHKGTIMLAAALAALTLLGLTGCGGNGGATANAPKSDPAASQSMGADGNAPQASGSGASNAEAQPSTSSSSPQTQSPSQSQPQKTTTPAATCSSVAGKYGAWQSDLEATVGDDCSIVTHSIGMPEDNTYTYPAATDPNVSVASDGSVTWNLKNGETAHMYPAGIQVQWFIDFTGESTDPTASTRRLLVYNSNGDIDLVFVGE